MEIMKSIKRVMNSFKFYSNLREEIKDLKFEFLCLKTYVEDLESDFKRISRKRRMNYVKPVGRPRKNNLTGSNQ